jgi:adenine-specific DNA-methyltransferase
METGGYLVAIIPRSFCTGLSYRPFREFMLKHAAVRRIHLFGSRNKAFKEDKVLGNSAAVVPMSFQGAVHAMADRRREKAKRDFV